MTKRQVKHSTFTIERTYNATAERVFAALTQPEHMKHWFHGPPEFGEETIEMDFRVGGGQRSWGGPKGGPVHKFMSRYYDIVANERLVYSYEMYLDDTRISVSLATWELRSLGPKKTELLLTEQGAFLDDFDDAGGRERGTKGLLDQFAKYVES